jgi:hypothetical protein
MSSLKTLIKLNKLKTIDMWKRQRKGIEWFALLTIEFPLKGNKENH